jgi:hypothetical protein
VLFSAYNHGTSQEGHPLRVTSTCRLSLHRTTRRRVWEAACTCSRALVTTLGTALPLTTMVQRSYRRQRGPEQVGDSRGDECGAFGTGLVCGCHSLSLTATSCRALPLVIEHCHCHSLSLTATSCRSLPLVIEHCHCHSLSLAATSCRSLPLPLTVTLDRSLLDLHVLVLAQGRLGP